MSVESRFSFWTWAAPVEAARADVAIIQALEEGQGGWSGLGLENAKPPQITRSQLKRLMEEGRVNVDGTALRPNSKLKKGDRVRLEIPPPESLEIVPEDRPLDILFEDKHLVVINKPPALTVHPSETQKSGTLVHALVHHIQDLSGIGGVLRPGIVHRIDKDTSGALVITKTDEAHLGLSEVFSKHEIERVYWALCYGAPEESGRTKPVRIESLLGRHPTDRKKMSMNVKKGKKAVTYYRTLKAFSLPEKKPFASWLEISLETGRTHQVRVHLTGIGHSILGDPVYGTPTERQPKWLALPNPVRAAVQNLPGQALHARVLGFKHPVTGKFLHFEAEPPESFKRVLDSLEKYK